MLLGLQHVFGINIWPIRIDPQYSFIIQPSEIHNQINYFKNITMSLLKVSQMFINLIANCNSLI